MVRKGLICPFNILIMNTIKSISSKVVVLVAMTFKTCFSYNTTVFYYSTTPQVDKWVKPYS